MTQAFQAEDTGGATFLRGKALPVEPAPVEDEEPDQAVNDDADAEPEREVETDKTTGSAEIRIDLSRIGGK